MANITDTRPSYYAGIKKSKIEQQKNVDKNSATSKEVTGQGYFR